MHRIFHMLHKLSVITYKEPIDGRFEDATAAILKDIYDSEEEDDEDDEALEVNANEEEDDEDDEANEEEDDSSEINVVT